MDLSTLFWEASSQELAQGFLEREGSYLCLVCGEAFEKGIVYPLADRFCEASRAIEEHSRHVHESRLDFLLALHKKYTGLSDSQIGFLQQLGQGKDDRSIAHALQISSSTVRNHRFRLKEKARQAKVFLAIVELAEQQKSVDTFIPPHRTATMIDDRYMLTQDEQKSVLHHYFDSQGRLKSFPAKEKKKLVILRHLSQLFLPGQDYSEKEVNAVLSPIFDDFATLRRYLIQYGFLERETDGSVYRKKA